MSRAEAAVLGDQSRTDNTTLHCELPLLINFFSFRIHRYWISLIFILFKNYISKFLLQLVTIFMYRSSEHSTTRIYDDERVEAAILAPPHLGKLQLLYLVSA